MLNYKYEVEKIICIITFMQSSKIYKNYFGIYMYILKYFLKEENDLYKIQKSSYYYKRGKRLIFCRDIWDFKVLVLFCKLGGYKGVRLIIFYILYII